MRRPKGKKFRNLTRSPEGVWRFQATNGEGKRVRVSLGTYDPDEAIKLRDEILAGTGGIIAAKRGSTTRFGEQAAHYLEYAPRFKALAATHRYERERLLKPKGQILRFFGDCALEDITTELLERYWTEEVLEAKDKDGEPKPRTPSTGKQDLAAISAVLTHARKRKLMTSDPCASFRAEISGAGTKAARAEQDPEKDIRPAETEKLAALVSEARKESLQDLVCVLLMLDAGLRSGEALGLRWRHIQWGTDEERNSRKLSIEENRPRGGSPEVPKSGRRRTVGLSRRLRAALLEFRAAKWNPSLDKHVLQGIEVGDWRNREWRRITQRAEVVARPKDLRSTFASVLLSNGIPLKYVSMQLGHATVAVTEKSYAKWCHGDDYVDPVRLSPADLPADLLTSTSDQKVTRTPARGAGNSS